MTSLLSQLKTIEERANATVHQLQIVANDKRSAQNVNKASIVLQWTRFAVPIVAELERVAPEFDFQKVHANGYRSLLSILKCSLDSFFQLVAKQQFHAIDDERLRSFAQSCELVLFGLIIHQFGHDGAKQTTTGPAKSLISRNASISHPCFQQLAAKCDAEIDSSHYCLAHINFGYSLPLQCLLRLVHSATIAVHDAEERSRESHVDSNSRGYNDEPVETSSCEKSAMELTKLRSTIQQSVNVVKGFFQALFLSLPLAPIDRVRVQRAGQICDACDVRFIQRCWNLSENPLIHAGELLTAPSVRHVEVLELRFAQFAVTIRLVCPFSRTTSTCSKLILHAHGGGFVAHTSKSHEGYLRRIAKQVGAPVVSIDYSNAPQICFPRPVDECFAVYKWLVEALETESPGNTDNLPTEDSGNRSVWTRIRQFSSCEQICFLGDSAGGNLMLSVLHQAVVHRMRLPVGAVCVYTPMFLHFAPSASRVVTLVDPLVPSRTLASCILAYFGRDYESTLASLEHQCEYHSVSGKTIGDLEHLCDQCSSKQIAGRQIDQWLCLLNRQRAQLFRNLPVVGRSRWQQQKAACAFAKLQSIREFAELSEADSEKLVSSEPLSWPDCVLRQLPRIALLTPDALDPTIDDNVDFAKRLIAADGQVSYDVVSGVPHGFLNFSNVCPNSSAGLELCVARIREILATEKPKQ